MNSIKELRADIGAVGTIESITSVYQGIASLRMNQVRESVLKTKKFIEGVGFIYHHAKTAYLASLHKILSSKDKAKIEALSKVKRNGKVAYVYLSANEHLYGSLILDIYKSFIADVGEDRQADVVVIGKFGKALVGTTNLANKIFYFEINDDKPAPGEITRVMELLIGYEKVVVHYGKMETLLTQVPERIEITGGVEEVGAPGGAVKEYLFEPSPEAIIDFFESEIIGALFNQKVFEHQLSRFAARMVAMDQASQNADVITDRLKKDFGRAKRRISNTKQLDVFAGMTLWEDLPAGRQGKDD